MNILSADRKPIIKSGKINFNAINETVNKTSNSIIYIPRQTLNFEQLNDRLKI